VKASRNHEVDHEVQLAGQRDDDALAEQAVPPGRLRAGRYRQFGEGVSGDPQGEWILEVLRAPEGVKAVPGGRRQ
jgi:hypothetical protein